MNRLHFTTFCVKVEFCLLFLILDRIVYSIQVHISRALGLLVSSQPCCVFINVSLRALERSWAALIG